MLSKICISDLIDDLDMAVEEISIQITDNFTLLKNSCGIVFCDSDMEQEEFVKKLKAKFDFDIIGCTAVAAIDGNNGFNDMSVTFMVLTADDCIFSAAVSEAITAQSITEQIELTYAKSIAKLDGEAKLIIALPPHNLNVVLDEYPNTFNRIAKGVPVVGGLPSFQRNGDKNLVLHNSNAYSDRLVLISISGNIRPLFSVSTIEGAIMERKRKVTSSKGNVIYRVGDKTFTEYLAEIGLDLAKLADDRAAPAFVANPILLEHVKLEEGDNFSFVRVLHDIDVKQGCGITLANVPEGATISISTMRRREIESSSNKGMEELAKAIKENEKDGYKYTTVMAVSCIGRYLVMAPANNAEVNQLIARLPEGMNMCGFYSYGEIGPLPGQHVGAVNFAHNESLVLCAF